jgi:DNA-binding transcriptional MerR regulator
MRSFFRPVEVQKLLHLSYRQLQYWDNTDMLKPSYYRKGKYRLYVFTDLVQLCFIKQLRSLGISIQNMRPLVKELKTLLPQLCHPVIDATIIVDGDRLIITNGDVFMCPKASKQYLVLKVSDLRDKVDEVFPEDVGLEDLQG